MHANEPSATILRFGAFEADLQTGRLTKQGKRIRLQEQPFQLLVMLLEAAGRVVTRDELRSKLWPQTIIDFDRGLNKAISKIREALGDLPSIRASSRPLLAAVIASSPTWPSFTTDTGKPSPPNRWARSSPRRRRPCRQRRKQHSAIFRGGCLSLVWA